MNPLSQLPFYNEDVLGTPVRDNYLPQELWNEIFKLLQNRKRALTTAAFVCKHWRDLTLPYLYAVMTVDVWRQPKSFVAFFEFLRQNTNIAGYVKELHLAGAPSEEGYESGFDVETLVDILPMLTALHTLSIKYCVFRVPSCISLVPATDARFPFLLRKLVISDCASAEPTGYLDTFSDFLSLFCADTLQVGGLLFPDPPDNHRRDYEMVAWRPKRCISTHNLVILPGAFFMLRHAAFNIHEFFARLLPPGALSAISSSFHLVSPPMLSHFHDFLRSAAAQNIVSIDLHLVWIVKWFPQVEDFEAAGLALSGCQNLLYLRIDIPGFVSRRTEDPARRSLLSTILRLAPCTIQVLAFRMTRLWEWFTPIVPPASQCCS